MEHQIRHLSTYSYDPAALRVVLRLKLYPVDFEGQQVQDWTVTVNDEPVEPIVLTGLGDREALWSAGEPLERLDIIAQGTVVTKDTAGVIRALPGHPPPALYRRSTRLTKPSDAIRALAEEARGEDALTTLHALMETINERIAYIPGSTTMATAAADVLKAGKGVCQDQAHLFVAAARAAGMPARYVTGYLQTEDDSADLLETHAWAEAHVDGIGWIGFDPSSNVCPTERYVRLCSGHDATAAAPIRGNVLGETEESLEVSVAIGRMQQ